jgi:hypothetical protein
MFSHTLTADDGTLPRGVASTCAPVHTCACGVAMGMAGAAAMLVMIILEITAGRHSPPIALFDQYFVGDSFTPVGAVIDGLGGFAIGFVTGWFVAFVRNVVMAASIFWIRTRAELRSTRDFLDHI